MDVIFEPQRGRSFSVEVGFFDTVLEIKEKVQKYQGIPVTRQTLVFNGQILEDKHDVAHCVILQNSLIHLIISPDPDKTQVVPNESLSPSPLPVSTPPVLQDDKIHLLIKRSSSSVHGHVEIHSHATVRRLKEKVYELEGGNVSINRLVLLSNGVELLHDQHSLYECEIFDQTEIEVMIKPSPSNSTGSGFNSSGPKKLSIMVLPKCGTKKVSVEMNPFDNVGQLRKELQLLQQNLHFSLPQEGYFFIYKQNVMDDDRSFRWHQVSQATQLKFLTAASLVDRKVNSSIRLFSYGRLD